MEENKKAILQFMENEQYVPMKAKELAYVLGITKQNYSEFQAILNQLENEFKVQVSKKGKYMLVDSNIYKTGIIRLNQKGFGFVTIENEEDEIYISERNINNALNGDEVLIEIFADTIDSKNHVEGKIIKILKHEKDTIVGTFQNSRNFGFVVPDDKKFGTDIFISKKNFFNAKNNQKVLVKITKFAEKGKKAEGKIIEILGNKDEAGIDILSLVKEYNLPYEFPAPVLSEAKKLLTNSIKNETFKSDELKSIDINISQEEKLKRLDLRDKEIFTIDGEDAKDLDDAISIEKNENGNYILGVHIADVSHYVKENSNLDNEAIIRGTSVYMMDRVIPMLPKELSNGICSLNENTNRFALSVIMEINDKGQVVSSDIRKTIIKVTKRMSYNMVYKILKYLKLELDAKNKCNKNLKLEGIDLEVTDKEQINNLESEITEENINLSDKDIELMDQYKKYFNSFKLMEELALILKNKREKDGSLDLDIPESKITLDENGVAIDVKKYEITFANQIIEQFMLIANETVAEKFYWLEAPFIYRVHPVPDIDKIKELNKFLWNLGYKIKCNKDNIHSKAFAEVLVQVKGKPEERVVSNLILRTLKIAQYESTNDGHFGIASKYYCHFTSPIRRYPDLYIHRIISKYIEKDYNLTENEIDEYTEKSIKFAKTSSEREKIAQKAERDSVDIKKAEYMSSKIGNEYDGIISNITSFGIFVELENTVEGLIRFENLGEEYFIYDEEHKRLIGEITSDVYNIGDEIHIRVIEANKELRRISFEKC